MSVCQNYRKPAFVYDELRGFGEMVFKDWLEDWAKPWQRLCQQDVVRSEGEKYALTESGAAYGERIAIG